MIAPSPLKRAYFVIVSPAYGGAEKRFFDIFRALRRQGADVMMIAPSSLAERLLNDHPDQPELASAFIAIPMQSWSPLAFVRQFRGVLKSIPRGSSFHYPMNCLWPLHLSRGDTISMSVTNCINLPGPRAVNRNSMWTWLSFFCTKRIDVLSPDILSRMTSYRTAGKMSLTPGGTFIEIVHQADIERAPTVVLLSRLVPLKGIDDWLDVLPQVWQALKFRTQPGFSFAIAGYGPLQEHVVRRIDALAAEGVPITFAGYADAAQFLPSVAVTLSMQEVTNYPSRVIAEALVSGCGAIVRNTGDSIQFGTDTPGLTYCAAELDPAELAEKILTLTTRVTSEPGYSDQIKGAAAQKFSGAATIQYFYDFLYPAG